MTDISTTPTLTAGPWTVDPSHSSVGFEARHAMVTKVRGLFTKYDADVQIAEDVTKSTVRASVDLLSVDTGNEQRDEHLRSSDFFLVEQHPTMEFESTSIDRIDDENYKLHGNLTVRGASRPVTFDLEFNGVTVDPWGNDRAGFSAVAVVNRKDWGLEWNVPLERGLGVLVGDKVKILLEVAVTRQPETTDDAS